MIKTCNNCGYQMDINHKICANCGTASEDSGFNNVSIKQEEDSQKTKPSVQIGWVVFSFFIPIVGWILGIVWKTGKPETAKYCGIAGCIGFLVNLYLMHSGVV